MKTWPCFGQPEPEESLLEKHPGGKKGIQVTVCLPLDQGGGAPDLLDSSKHHLGEALDEGEGLQIY